jgi:hypothetical protein
VPWEADASASQGLRRFRVSAGGRAARAAEQIAERVTPGPRLGTKEELRTLRDASEALRLLQSRNLAPGAGVLRAGMVTSPGRLSGHPGAG